MSGEFEDQKRERRDLRAKITGMRHVKDLIERDLEIFKERVKELNELIPKPNSAE
jgi:hypothetical protein